MFINNNKNGELHQRNMGSLQWFSLKCMKFMEMKTLNKKTREENYENENYDRVLSQLVRFTIDLFFLLCFTHLSNAKQ